jgi:hypothetical protein
MPPASSDDADPDHRAADLRELEPGDLDGPADTDEVEMAA